MTWGVEDVSRATGIPRRTLHRWHSLGWATASETQGRCLRYTEANVRRVATLKALRATGAPRRQIAFIAKAIDAETICALREIRAKSVIARGSESA